MVTQLSQPIHPVSWAPAQPFAAMYLGALLVGDRAGAEIAVRDALASGWSLHDIYVRIFQETLYEVGRRWELGEIDVAQEHFCTAATQHLMASLYDQTLHTPKGSHRLLATSIGGNFHSIGIRMLSDVFELHGWGTTYLGADTPSPAILEALTKTSYDVLAISAALEEHVPAVAELIGVLRAAIPDLRILVGGRPFNADLALWREVGADGHAATPQGAVELASAWLGEHVAPTQPTSTPILELAQVVNRSDARSERALLDGMSRLNSQAHDMTRALAEKNAELERLNQQINRMMGIAAHDLRNPLTIIGCNSQFLREDLESTLSADHRELLDAIDDSGAFMKRLLDDLLDVSSVRAGKLKLDLESIDVGALVLKCVQRNQPLANRKQIALAIEVPSVPLECDIDPAKIQQLINNLVGNAIQYSMPATEVRVTLDATATTLRLVVLDRGKGIPAAELAKVFRAFETTSTRGTAGEKSTGLGLAIVQAIVEAHQGRVWVESTLNVGSSFHVELPVRRSA